MSDGIELLVGATVYVFAWGALYHVLKDETDGPLFAMLWPPFLLIGLLLSPLIVAWMGGAWFAGKAQGGK